MVTLPRKIYFTAMGKEWKLSYIRKPGKLMLLELPHRKLVVYGKRYSKRAAIELLCKWVRMKAKKFLIAQLIKTNHNMKFKYKKIRIHSLKMEWGSYSSNGTLSLNYKLIFLPPALVRHIIIHELCHFRYPDHSPAFWKEVAKFDKSWKRNKKAMHTAEIYIPEWMPF